MAIYHSPRYSRGFTLPTVLIVSVLMLSVLAVTLQLVSATSASLRDQYYNQIAREAAESGLAMANACLATNEYFVTWTTTKPLRPNTDCFGEAVSGASSYVISSEALRTSFSVGAAVDTGTGTQSISAQGFLEQVQASTSTVWRRHTQTQVGSLGGTLGQQYLVLGYASSGTCAGVYFFSFSSSGIAQGVGANGCGQLGKGDTTNAISPYTVVLLNGARVATKANGQPLIFAHFLSGGSNTIIIGTDGNAYFAGENTNGAGGIGSVTPARVTTFTRVALPAGQRAVYAVSSGRNSYIITEAGYVYAAGICSDGQLGNNTSGTSCSIATTPVRMTLPTPSTANESTWPASIYLDGQSRYLIMKDGSVYSWGQNDYGQLGLGDKTIRATPTKVSGYGSGTGVKALRIETTGPTTFILGNNGVVKGAGLNNYGRLGRGFVGTGTGCASSGCPTFKPVQLPSTATAGSQLVDVRTDNVHAAFLTNKGQVFTTGLNHVGQLGCGTPVNGTACPNDIGTSLPVLFQLPAGVSAVSVYATSARDSVELSLCGENTYVIGSDGRVYGAGCNRRGQLGNGCNLSSSTSCQEINGTPVSMGVINGTTVIATSVVSGRGTTVVRATNGFIYTVGANEYGQLGDGTTNDSSTPKRHRFVNSSQPLSIF